MRTAIPRPADPLRSAFVELKPALLAVAAISLGVNLLVFASPLYSMQVYDRVLTSRSGTTLAMITLIVLALFVAYAALEHYRSRTLVAMGVKLDKLLSGEAFDTALRSSLRHRGPQHVQLLRDVDTLRDVASGGVVASLLDVPWVPIYLAVCFMLHPLLGAVATVGAVALVGLAYANENLTKRPLVVGSAKGLQALDRLMSSLRNAEAIRGLGMAPAVRDQWSVTHHEALAANVAAGERGGSVLAASKFLRMALQSVIMGVGAYLVITQQASGGVMFASSLIMGRALAPLEGVVGQWKALVSARVAWRRLGTAFANLPREEVRTRLPEPKGALTVERLTVAAPGGATAILSDVSLSFEPGQVVCVVGPTGSGKSTLARSVVGAWEPARGCIRLDGSDIRHYDHDQLGRALGYLPQDVELFSGSIRDNVARFRSDATDEQVVEAATKAGANGLIQRMVNGYDTDIGEDGVALSGGQRQRIGLARALFGKPALLVLDEPNANLDGEGDIALAAALVQARQDGQSALVVTHKPNLLAIADRVVIMAEGKVVRQGTRDEILPLIVGPNVAVRKVA